MRGLFSSNSNLPSVVHMSAVLKLITVVELLDGFIVKAVISAAGSLSPAISGFVASGRVATSLRIDKFHQFFHN